MKSVAPETPESIFLMLLIFLFHLVFNLFNNNNQYSSLFVFEEPAHLLSLS